MPAIFTGGTIRMIKIAVCDDDEIFISKTLKHAVSVAVKSAEITPKIFIDGTSLLDRFQNGEYYDIVILDIDMPKINGKELAAKLR